MCGKASTKSAGGSPVWKEGRQSKGVQRQSMSHKVGAGKAGKAKKAEREKPGQARGKARRGKKAVRHVR